MAQTAAYAAGPIAFLNADGRQLYVPLDAFTLNGGVVTLDSGFPPAGYDATAIQKWLQYLVAAGQITSTPAAAPTALTLQAATAGAGGTDITVQIAYPDPSVPTYTITAKQTDTFFNLSPANTVGAVTEVNSFGAGLVQATGPGGGYMPPYAQTITRFSGSGTAEFTSSSEMVFATTTAGPDAALTSVTVATGSPSDTVTLEWEKTFTVTPPTSFPPAPGQLTQKQQIDAALAFLSITSSPDVAGPGGTTVLVPLAGTVTFAGPPTSPLTAPLPGPSATTALTLSLPTAYNPTPPPNVSVSSSVTVTITSGATSYQVDVHRTDVVTGTGGHALAAADLVTLLGTTGAGTTPPTTVTVPGLVVVRGTGVPSGFSLVAVPKTSLGILGPDGRYEAGLGPGQGLQIAVSSPVSALANMGTWAVTAAPDASGTTFTLTASWSNSATVDTTALLLTQTNLLTGSSGAFTSLLTATLDPISGLTAPTIPPQVGSYPLQSHPADNKALVNVPARS